MWWILLNKIENNYNKLKKLIAGIIAIGGIENEQNMIAIIENALKIRTAKERKAFLKEYIDDNNVIPIETTWNREVFVVKRVIANTSESALAKIVYCSLRDEVNASAEPILIEENEIGGEEDDIQ